MTYDDQRIFRTFEEFEREELRKADGFGGGIDQVLGDMFAEELDLEVKSSRRHDNHDSADEDDE